MNNGLDAHSMDLFTTDLHAAITEDRPTWLKIFRNGSCEAGSLNRSAMFMTVSHMQSMIKVDLDEYDTMHMSLDMFSP